MKVQEYEDTRVREYESTNHPIKMHVMSYNKMCTRVRDISVLEVTYLIGQLYIALVGTALKGQGQ